MTKQSWTYAFLAVLSISSISSTLGRHYPPYHERRHKKDKTTHDSYYEHDVYGYGSGYGESKTTKDGDTYGAEVHSDSKNTYYGYSHGGGHAGVKHGHREHYAEGGSYSGHHGHGSTKAISGGTDKTDYGKVKVTSDSSKKYGYAGGYGHARNKRKGREVYVHADGHSEGKDSQGIAAAGAGSSSKFVPLGASFSVAAGKGEDDSSRNYQHAGGYVKSKDEGTTGSHSSHYGKGKGKGGSIGIGISGKSGAGVAHATGGKSGDDGYTKSSGHTYAKGKDDGYAYAYGKTETKDGGEGYTVHGGASVPKQGIDGSGGVSFAKGTTKTSSVHAEGGSGTKNSKNHHTATVHGEGEVTSNGGAGTTGDGKHVSTARVSATANGGYAAGKSGSSNQHGR